MPLVDIVNQYTKIKNIGVSMFDSVDEKSKKMSDKFADFSIANKLLKTTEENLILDLQSQGILSEAEMKFLSVSKEKKTSVQTVDNIIKRKISLENFEVIFCLENYVAEGGTINPDQVVRNIRYKDKNGTIVAIVQIDNLNKKIRLQNLGNILPKQETFTPYQVGTKLEKLAKFKKWSIEDGGLNQFNSNVEIRYKDEYDNVMAAVITKPNGLYDTIAEYEYINGNRSKMLLTNHYGQSIVVYDGTENVRQITRIDIDTDGVIIEITKVFD